MRVAAAPAQIDPGPCFWQIFALFWAELKKVLRPKSSFGAVFSYDMRKSVNIQDFSIWISDEDSKESSFGLVSLSTDQHFRSL